MAGDLDLGLARRRTAHGLMEGHQGSIVVVIGGLGILIVRHSLGLPLLAVVGNLNDSLSGQFNLRSLDLKGVLAYDFSFQFLGRESDSNITQAWLLKVHGINRHFSTAFKRTSDRADGPNFSLFVVSELDVLGGTQVFFFPANNLFASIDGNSNNVVVTVRALVTSRMLIIVV